MSPEKLSRTDWLAAAVLWACTFVLFGSGAPRLGFYYDDAGYLTDLPAAGLHALAGLMTSAIRGRQFFVLWQYLFFNTIPHAASHLAALHLIQSVLDGLTVAGFFLTLRVLHLPAHAAVTAAGLFAFWPIHGETHFWLNAASLNLASTLLVLLFIVTSIAFTSGRRSWRLWMLDFAAFVAALFTYDQVVVALAAVLAVRLGIALHRRVARPAALFAFHAPHLAAVLGYLFLRPATDPNGLSIWRPDTFRLLRMNLAATVSYTTGVLWFRHVLPLLANAAWTDWLLAVLLAAVLAALALRLLPASPRLPASLSSRTLLILSILFYATAYLPIWLWYMSARHHFLPSVGLFAAGAAVLAWLLDRLFSRPARVACILLLGAVSAVFAAAGRGESRFWEQSFSARKQLFAELTPRLARAGVLVLDGFPGSLGPAMFITPHDAEYTPHLLAPHVFPGRVTGSLGGVPAPSGIFIHTSSSYGSDVFRYCPAAHPLIVRFTSWENGIARYEIRTPSVPYTVSFSDPAPAPGSFAVHRAAARYEGGSLVVSLDLNANLAPETWLAATLDYFHESGFHRWGRLDRFLGYETLPVLLGEAGLHPSPGGARFQPAFRIPGFPSTTRIRVEFFQVSQDNAPLRLGEAETAVQL